ncbi:MAG TPA: CoA-binding protein [Sphingomonas sp.]|nr:CoA-binding protein [Sphingomonas sp.]
MPLTRDEDIKALLEGARTIAMVGASDRPDRPSYGVMKFLQGRGYRVIPVNPQIVGEHVHGEYVFGALADIGEPIDIVDIFRRPLAAGEAVGLKVVMDRCPAIEIPRLGVAKVA